MAPEPVVINLSSDEDDEPNVPAMRSLLLHGPPTTRFATPPMREIVERQWKFLNAPAPQQPQAPTKNPRDEKSPTEDLIKIYKKTYVRSYSATMQSLMIAYVKEHFTRLCGDAAYANKAVDELCKIQRPQRVIPKKDYSCRPADEEEGDLSVVAILPGEKPTADRSCTSQDRASQEPKPQGNFKQISCNISRQVYDSISAIVHLPPRHFPNSRHICSRNSCGVTIKTSGELRGVPSFLIPLWHGFKRQYITQPSGAKTFFYMTPCGLKLSSIEQVDQYLTELNITLDVDVFTFQDIRLGLPRGAFTPVACFHYLKDLSYGRESQPIPVINSVDSKSLSGGDSYFYMEKRLIDHAKLQTSPSPDFVSCCSCEDNCRSRYCECKMLSQKGLVKRSRRGDDHDSVLEVPFYYESKRLHKLAVTAIYECNHKCPCNWKCSNRVVQNGIKVQIEIFRTAKKGWGVRAKQDIPAGTFICTYAAEVLTMSVSNSRHSDTYFAELDYIECAEAYKEGYEEFAAMSSSDSSADEEDTNDDSSEREDAYGARERGENYAPHKRSEQLRSNYARRRRERESKTIARKRIRQQQRPILQSLKRPKGSRKKLRQIFPDHEPFILDALHKGNVGRFLNHSCDPNCFVQSVFIETHDPRLPHVCVFAQKNIKFNDELCWNYGYQVDSVPNKVLICHCGAENCKGRLL